MGIERMHPPHYWEMRAEELHNKADHSESPEARKSLRDVTKTYEQLARRAEQIRTIQDAAE